MPGVEKATLDIPGQTRMFTRGKAEVATVAGSPVDLSSPADPTGATGAPDYLRPRKTKMRGQGGGPI